MRKKIKVRQCVCIIKKVIKWLFNSIGYEILRLEKVPRISLLGIKSIPIRTIIDVGANKG